MHRVPLRRRRYPLSIYACLFYFPRQSRSAAETPPIVAGDLGTRWRSQQAFFFLQEFRESGFLLFYVFDIVRPPGGLSYSSSPYDQRQLKAFPCWSLPPPERHIKCGPTLPSCPTSTPSQFFFLIFLQSIFFD